MESGEAPWQQGGASTVGEEAEVDADEALGGAIYLSRKSELPTSPTRQRPPRQRLRSHAQTRS